MIFVIIASVICLAAATLMYTPRMRNFAYYRPIAFLFLFEGAWMMVDYIFTQLIPNNLFMPIIHYIGISVLILYFVICIFTNTKTKKPKNLTKKRGD